jgi:hypothetical protein
MRLTRFAVAGETSAGDVTSVICSISGAFGDLAASGDPVRYVDIRSVTKNPSTKGTGFKARGATLLPRRSGALGAV